MNATSIEIDNAFVVGISASGAQKLFDKLCTRRVTDANSPIFGQTPGQMFNEKVRPRSWRSRRSRKSIAAACSCDPEVTMKVDTVTVGRPGGL